MAYQSLNPATEEILKTYPQITWEQVEKRAKKSRQAFAAWSATPIARRAELFSRLAERLLKEKERHAAVITREMGKPITESEAEIEKCARGCQYYIEHAEAFLRDEKIESDAGKSYVRYDPLGTILIIMPWNFPYWQVLRCAIPAIMAGNAVLLKHASNVPECALEIERVFREAGFPDDLFRSLFCASETVARLIESPWVQGVSLTGSDLAGSRVAEAAGRALKKVVLELGGSDPFIVLSDADLAKCIPHALRSRMLNAGQSCIAAKRFILAQPIASDFEAAFLKAVREQVMGDPMNRATKIGPLARKDLVDDLDRQVQESIRQGAKCLVGGKRPDGKGFYYPPTVLKEVRPGMPVFEEEVFGPVASLIVAKSEEEAITLANQTPYGLGASLWTRDTERAEKIAPKLETGNVFINGMTKSDPRLPFGGVKRSGFGRELSMVGIREFTNLKTVWIA